MISEVVVAESATRKVSSQSKTIIRSVTSPVVGFYMIVMIIPLHICFLWLSLFRGGSWSSTNAVYPIEQTTRPAIRCKNEGSAASAGLQLRTVLSVIQQGWSST